MAQKGAGGNPGAITSKGGDGAGGSTGTGRGGGNNARGLRRQGRREGLTMTSVRHGRDRRDPARFEHRGPSSGMEKGSLALLVLAGAATAAWVWNRLGEDDLRRRTETRLRPFGARDEV